MRWAVLFSLTTSMCILSQADGFVLSCTNCSVSIPVLNFLLFLLVLLIVMILESVDVFEVTLPLETFCTNQQLVLVSSKGGDVSKTMSPKTEAKTKTAITINVKKLLVK